MKPERDVPGSHRRILLSGATGFIGSAALAALRTAGHNVTGVSRRPAGRDFARADVTSDDGWASLMAGIDLVIHLGAWNPPRWKDPRPELHEAITRDGAIRVAGHAARANVGRLVFLSSARVYGLPATGQSQFRESDALAARDAYGRAKAMAEIGIAEALAGSASRLTVLRAPVVYGRGRLGSIGSLALAARHGLPLALPRGDAAKSVLALGNLLDCLKAIAAGADGFDGTFNIADPEPITLSGIADVVAHAHGRDHARRMPQPLSDMLLGRLMPVEALAHLAAPIVLDTGRLRASVSWRPPHSTADALRSAFGPER